MPLLIKKTKIQTTIVTRIIHEFCCMKIRDDESCMNSILLQGFCNEGDAEAKPNNIHF